MSGLIVSRVVPIAPLPFFARIAPAGAVVLKLYKFLDNPHVMAQFFRSSQPDFMKKHGHKLSQVKKCHKTFMEEKAGALFKDGVVECPEAADEEGLNAWKKANKNAAPSCSHVPAPTSLACSMICVALPGSASLVLTGLVNGETTHMYADMASGQSCV